jgi:hypothetical protein
MMFGRTESAQRLVPLTTLVGESFGTSPGELVDTLAARGSPSSWMTPAVWRSLRQWLRRCGTREPRRSTWPLSGPLGPLRLPLSRRPALRRQEAQARRLDHIRQLEQAFGASVMQLEMGLRDFLVNNVPNLDPRRLEGNAFTLGELERVGVGAVPRGGSRGVGEVMTADVLKRFAADLAARPWLSQPGVVAGVSAGGRDGAGDAHRGQPATATRSLSASSANGSASRFCGRTSNGCERRPRLSEPESR